MQAARYREEGTVQVTEGWIRHTYLEWPNDMKEEASRALPTPKMPPAYNIAEPADATAAMISEDLSHQLHASQEVGLLPTEIVGPGNTELHRFIELLMSLPSG